MWNTLSRSFSISVYTHALPRMHAATDHSNETRDRFLALHSDGGRRDRWLLPSLSLVAPSRTDLILIAAAVSLGLFVWLLSLHPHAAGRTYTAYGGVYVDAALACLWAVDGVRPDRWDILGVTLCLIGIVVIYFSPRGTP
jgi:small multidrug resistance family-3 protein